MSDIPQNLLLGFLTVAIFLTSLATGENFQLAAQDKSEERAASSAEKKDAAPGKELVEPTKSLPMNVEPVVMDKRGDNKAIESTKEASDREDKDKKHKDKTEKSADAKVPEKPVAATADANDSAKPASTETPKQGALPWSKQTTAPAAVVRRAARSARELLVNLDDSQLQAFMDRRPLVIDEEESLIRVLFRVPKFGQRNVEELAREITDWKPIFDEPEKYRIEIYKLQGRVQKIERSELLPELKSRYEFSEFFRVTMQLNDSPYRAVICTQSVPEVWKKATELDEPASAYGLFLKVGEAESEHPELVFAAPRVAWHPDTVNPRLGILPDHALLGSLGMDLGLFDDVRGTSDKNSRNGKDISPEESECFYQLLRAVKKTTQAELEKNSIGPFTIAPLLQDPRAQHGKLMTIQGLVHRITRIDVENPDFRKRFGLDHYYELYVHFPLGDAEVRLSGDKHDKNAPVIRGSFPIACCVTELPPAWQKMAKGSNEPHELVRITGFNFKLWAYQSQMMQRYIAEESERAAKNGADPHAPKRRPLQPSPLFIAPQVEFLPSESIGLDAASNAISVAMFVVFLIVTTTAVSIWYYRGSDLRGQTALQRQRLAAKNDNSPNASNDKPDFSGLG